VLGAEGHAWTRTLRKLIDEAGNNPSFQKVTMSFFLRMLGLDTKPQSVANQPHAADRPQERVPEATPDVQASPHAEPDLEIPGSGSGPAVMATNYAEPYVEWTTAGAEKQSVTSWKLDAGEGVPVADFTGLGIDSKFDAERGFGWVQGHGLAYRDRNIDDRLLGRFIVSVSDKPACLRMTLKSGIYTVAIVMGDYAFGNHVLQVASNGISDKLPALTASSGEYAVLVTTAQPVDGVLDLTFTSPTSNWVVNAVQICPASDAPVIGPKVIRRNFGESYADIL
jgi:hypothetical protein